MYDYQTLKNKLLEKTANDLYCDNIDDLTTMQKSKVDSMAWELSGLYAELQKSNEYIAERLKEKLQPETINRPIPDHRVVQITPEKAIIQLSTEQSFDYKTGHPNLPPIYFSPLYPTKVFKGEIVCRVAKAGIYEKKERTELVLPTELHKSECWLGLRLDERITSLDGLGFYFPNKNSLAYKENELGLVKAKINQRAIKVKVGLKKKEELTPIDFYETLWMRNSVEKPIYDHYKNQFLTIQKEANVLKVKDLKSSFPVENNEVVYLLFEEQLVWVNLIFPFEVKGDFLKNIAINVVPVLNRKFIRHQDIVLDKPENWIPLTRKDTIENAIKEYFLGLDRVYSATQRYQPAITSNFNSLPLGSYALKYGRPTIPSLDNALKSVYALLALIKKEEELALIRQIFKIEDRPDIEKPLVNLQNSLKSLKVKLKESVTEKPYYFLFIKSGGLRENLFLHYWVTQGIQLKDISIDGKWQAERLTITNFLKIN